VQRQEFVQVSTPGCETATGLGGTPPVPWPCGGVGRWLRGVWAGLGWVLEVVGGEFGVVGEVVGDLWWGGALELLTGNIG
jgi:hypothetical protein